MDNSTEGVTLNAAFVNDVLELYKDKPNDYMVLSEMAAGHNLSNPNAKVPIEVYNKMCDYIEKSIGQANTRKVGRKIGNTAFNAMVQFKLMPEKPSPEQAMKALQVVASTMIQDPKGRGWELTSIKPKEIIMKRTQTFNSTLQFGLLDEIIRKTGVSLPKVEYLKEVSKGDDFDEYKISWV